jgi:hypothetical protein
MCCEEGAMTNPEQGHETGDLGSDVIQQLEKIAKAISQLEGMKVPYGLAMKLAKVAIEIAEYCAP